LALATVLADRFLLAKRVAPAAATKSISDKSIAVLPFTDMSEKKDQEYFADGIAEEVLGKLCTGAAASRI
jgi:TolB-like protein